MSSLVASWAKIRGALRRPRTTGNSRFALLCSLLVTSLVATIGWHPRPLLVWNASTSVPVGLYAIGGLSHPVRGGTVLARLPTAWRKLAAERHYIPEAIPLVKTVAAVSGDRVCASGQDIFVNGERVAHRLAADNRGRALPWWKGCRLLDDELVFLLTSNPSSFDGRYFGPVESKDLIGQAWLLWAR